MRVILNMEFYSSAEMKISLAPEQTEWLSSYDDIRTIIKDNPDTVMAFDIYDSGDLIGFVLVHRFGERKFFIWEYAIDIDHQDQHKFNQDKQGSHDDPPPQHRSGQSVLTNAQRRFEVHIPIK